jgi:glutamyl-tRNA reductase
LNPVTVVGVSHRSAPLEFLERVSYRPDEIAARLSLIIELPGAREAVLLSTCNRTEIYVAGDTTVAAVIGFLARDRSVLQGELDPYVETRSDDEAVRHLFRVASGLDSMILGESEIQGQVRRARAAAHEVGSLGRTLDDVFESAVRAGRRVRRETPLGVAHRSIGSAAVELAGGVMKGLKGRTVLVLGTGKVARSVLRSLVDERAQLVVCGRTRDRARSLAIPYRAVISLSDLETHLIDADVVFCCTGADAMLIEPEMLKGASETRTKGELVIVDLSLPRNVDAAVQKLEGIRLLNLQDVGAKHGRESRELLKTAESAEQIVSEEVERFHMRIPSRQASSNRGSGSVMVVPSSTSRTAS